MNHGKIFRDELFATGHKMNFCRFSGGWDQFIPGKLITRPLTSSHGTGDLPSDGSRGHRDRFGRSALHLAALQGVVGLCRMLINHGAEVDCQVRGEQGGKRYLM